LVCNEVSDEAKRTDSDLNFIYKFLKLTLLPSKQHKSLLIVYES